MHSFNAINKFEARSTSEMWWDSTIDIQPGLQAFNMVGQEIACPAPREREHSPLPTGLVDLRKSSPVKHKTDLQVPRNVSFDGKTPLFLDMMLDFSVYYLKKCLKS